ncbi:DUF1329 domain-containing protein [Solimonas marina]|uniref:DUF1329 domain-containing protein n=1 Tax=Solimonas marina TaxID=2714601 RepID=A0A970B3L9_9GAMM|nr:DUF1329 domain-containing protein [Solimonas marina]NKF21397.1 DUF1329 domain-containing protein [Solimonas marina]
MQLLLVACCFGSAAAHAGEAASPKAVDAAALGGTQLTPYGAEVAGNRDGTIPAWNGGLTAAPPCFAASHGRYCDPYADDRPLYTITAANADEYAALLSPGQRALLAAYPETFRMRVFPTRRSFSNPPAVYAASARNAPVAVLDDDTLKHAATGVPFPIPATGAEVLWNHRLRWRPLVTDRVSTQFTVAADGGASSTRQHELVHFDYGAPDYDLRKARGILLRRMQWIEQPAHLGGVGVLLIDAADPDAFAKRCWQVDPGDRVAQHVPSLAFDMPAIGSEGLRTNDQLDTYFGPLNRYQLELVGKREMIVPANSYALHDAAMSYSTLIGPHHLNPDLTRYELRRVWVVDAKVRPGVAHRYPHRRFYVDEDGWQLRIVDVYDARDRLWQVQEAHTLMAYDRQFELPVAQTVYDLQSSRYLVYGLNNEETEVAYPNLDTGDFGPNDLARRGRPWREGGRS